MHPNARKFYLIENSSFFEFLHSKLHSKNIRNKIIAQTAETNGQSIPLLRFVMIIPSSYMLKKHRGGASGGAHGEPRGGPRGGPVGAPWGARWGALHSASDLI